MDTIIEKVDPAHIDTDVMEQAGKLIAEGELVAFPTETVYGLGGDALDPDASRRIYAAKGRPSDNPLIVHIADFDDMKRVAREVPEQAKKLADAFWPGPLTMIVWKSDAVPEATTGGDNRRHADGCSAYAESSGSTRIDSKKRMPDCGTECQYVRSAESDRGTTCCGRFIGQDCDDTGWGSGRHRN